jgi:hypothetical protein
MSARWVTVSARWVRLRARWVILRARWVTLRARWVTLRARWVALRARWVMLIPQVVCVTGTTAFPSARWKGGNGPEATDYTGNVLLIDEIKRTNPDLKRFIFVSSIGCVKTV